MNHTPKDRILSLAARPAVFVLLIFFLGSGIFLPTLGYDFVWDDHILVTENPQIKSIPAWPRLLISKVPLSPASVFYRPLFMLSLAWDYTLYKENPWGYHLTSSLLHGINSALVAYLAFLLFQAPWAALMAGAFFALHPAHPEAVAFIGARVDLLATLFSLLALIAMVKKPKYLPAWSYLLGAPLFFLLALLSKETAVVILIPMALLLYQKSREPFPGLQAAALKFLPSVLMIIPYLVLRRQAVETAPAQKLNFFSSPCFGFELFWRYLSFLIFPPQQASFLRDFRGFYPLEAKFWLLAGLTLFLLALIIYVIYRRRETAPFFALIILPCLPALWFTLGVDIIMIDRYLYLPTAGLALLVAWGFLQAPKGWEKRAALGMILLLGLYGGATLWRTPLWKNEVILFEAFKKETPSAAYVRANLGIAYEKNNRFREAYQEISEAIKLDPLDFRYRNNFGRLCLRLGWVPRAREAFTESLRLNPGNAPALEGLGLSYVPEGDYDTALKYLDQALRADPGSERVLKNRMAVGAMKPALKK